MHITIPQVEFVTMVDFDGIILQVDVYFAGVGVARVNWRLTHRRRRNDGKLDA